MTTATANYPASPATRSELEQLAYCGESSIRAAANRALHSPNQLGVIFANSELEHALRQNPAIIADLDAAYAAALAAEVLPGGHSFRFPA